MLLNEILKRNSNNLDIFRIIAACMVILGHAYAISPQAGKTDVIAHWFGLEYSGSIAVKIFFFISGLVVANSLFSKRDPIAFVIARFFRIFPALFFVLFITTFVMGPFLSTINYKEYFSNPAVYSYFTTNIKLQTTYLLPGVFSNNPLHDSVNGSLWTLPYEVGAYIVLLGFFMIGLSRNRMIGTIVAALIIGERLLPEPLFFSNLGVSTEVNLLPACFAFGCLLALNKDRIRINHATYLGLALLTWFFWQTRYAHLLFLATVCLGVLVCSGASLIKKLKPRHDISYGVYLWGFPLQQYISTYYPHNILVSQLLALALALALVMGYVSWITVEQRGIRLGVFCNRMLNHQFVKSICWQKDPPRLIFRQTDI